MSKLGKILLASGVVVAASTLVTVFYKKGVKFIKSLDIEENYRDEKYATTTKKNTNTEHDNDGLDKWID